MPVAAFDGTLAAEFELVPLPAEYTMPWKPNPGSGDFALSADGKVVTATRGGVFDVVVLIDARFYRISVEHPEQVAAYRAGKQAVLEFLVGQAMRRSSGLLDPRLVREELIRAIGSGH